MIHIEPKVQLVKPLQNNVGCKVLGAFLTFWGHLQARPKTQVLITPYFIFPRIMVHLQQKIMIYG